MTNIEAVNALITAINFDRFAEIEARHAPDATFISFRGPTCIDSISIGDWHREFLEAYADCNYAETEYIEQGDIVVAKLSDQRSGVFHIFPQLGAQRFEVGFCALFQQTRSVGDVFEVFYV